MTPGESLIEHGDIELNVGRRTLTLSIANTGDRPIQVGSHFHFFESNEALHFERDAARGMRLNIAAGTAVRFEPGQKRTVELVELSGAKQVFGFQGKVMGPLDKRSTKHAAEPSATKRSGKKPAPSRKSSASIKSAKVGVKKQ